jgi:plastocyanin
LFSGSLLVGVTEAGAEPAAVDWSNVKTVQVGMAHFDFTAKSLQFHANVPYRRRFTNSASHGHSFDAPEFFAAVTIAPEDESKVVKGEVEGEGGRTVEVKFVPSSVGSYGFHCSHFLHSAFGMTGHVLIE